MSGGSLGYAYGRIETISEEVAQRAFTPLHEAFAVHLAKVAYALHDLEWVLSGDYSPGDEVEPIRAVLPEGAELKQVVDEAKAVYTQLEEAIAAAEKRANPLITLTVK